MDERLIVLNDQGGSVMSVSDKAGTLRAQEHGHPPVICLYAIEGNVVDRASAKNGKGWCEDVSPTLNTQDRHAVVYALEGNGARPSHMCKGFSEDGTMYTLNTIERHSVCYGISRSMLKGGEGSNGGMPVAEEIQPSMTANGCGAVVYDARGNGDGGVCPTITGDHENRITDYTALAVSIGNGQLNQMSMEPVANALDCMHDQQAVLTNGKPPRKYIVRRLTPLECARLQGFPDWWTDGAEGSDSAIYKMWGNGIALPCAADVIGRIAQEIRRAQTDGQI